MKSRDIELEGIGHKKHKKRKNRTNSLLSLLWQKSLYVPAQIFSFLCD